MEKYIHMHTYLCINLYVCFDWHTNMSVNSRIKSLFSFEDSISYVLAVKKPQSEILRCNISNVFVMAVYIQFFIKKS